MIDLKTPEEISSMRQGGQKLGQILVDLMAFADTGVSLQAIEDRAMAAIKKAGAVPSFTTVEGYRWATCLCVNDVVVHGIPTPYVLKEDDILTIDVGLIYKGFHTDTAWSKVVGSKSSELSHTRQQFLDVGEKALKDAIAQAKLGNRIGHISQVLQNHIESHGFHIVTSLVGHGVGRTLHEEPQVPGVLRRDLEKTPELVLGETIAIEVIYAKDTGKVIYDSDDGWSIATKDGSDSAVFEHTVAITQQGPIVLTQAE